MLDVEKEIKNFKIFAEQISQLHMGICEWNNKELCSYLLYQKGYEKNESVKKWRTFVQNVFDGGYDRSCLYLKNIEEAIEEYSWYTVCPGNYNYRLEALANSK